MYPIGLQQFPRQACTTIAFSFRLMYWSKCNLTCTTSSLPLMSICLISAKAFMTRAAFQCEFFTEQLYVFCLNRWFNFKLEGSNNSSSLVFSFGLTPGSKFKIQSIMSSFFFSSSGIHDGTLHCDEVSKLKHLFQSPISTSLYHRPQFHSRESSSSSSLFICLIK